MWDDCEAIPAILTNGGKYTLELDHSLELIIDSMFGSAGKVRIEGGTFTTVQGDAHFYGYPSHGLMDSRSDMSSKQSGAFLLDYPDPLAATPHRSFHTSPRIASPEYRSWSVS